MRKLAYLFIAAVASFAVSCNKDQSVAPQSNDGKPMKLVVGVSGVGSKVTGITSNDETTEAKVNSLQVFVFNGDVLDGYASATDSKTATVSCTSGSRDIYALVNAPNLSTVSSKATLLATVSNLANEVSNFQMIGSKTETLQHDGSVNLTVSRLAARVVVKGIKNALENATQAAAFKILSITLTNAVGDVNYGLSSGYEPLVWRNRRGYEAANSLGGFDHDEVNATVAAGATNSDVHFFYTYPNAKDPKMGIETGATGYTPRRARLVITAEIAETVYHYPIELPVLENNKSYEINLVNITRLGNVDNGYHDPDDNDDDDEEKPIQGFDQAFSITVNNWSVVLLGNEGTINI